MDMRIGGLSGFGLTQMAQDIFKKLDANGDSSIDKQEFEAVITKLGGFNVQDTDKIFGQIDTNGDGKIDQSEIENALKK